LTTKYIILDAWRDNCVKVSAVKGETAARFLEVTLTGNGAAINLADKTAAIYFKKPDGTTIFNAGTIKDASAGLVEFPLTAQMSAVSGDMQNVEIRLTQTGGGTLKIIGLAITVLPAADYDAAVESTDEYTALTAALGDTTEFASHTANKSNPHGVTAAQVGAVPTGRTVNEKPLSADVALTASDIPGIANLIYPVGSIYMSVGSTSPATLFGGTWEQIKDKFLLSAGDNRAAGATGGAETHTLTKEQIPDHMHETAASVVGNPEGVYKAMSYTNGDIVVGQVYNTNPTYASNCGGQAFSIMPPYLSVYIWKRTA